MNRKEQDTIKNIMVKNDLNIINYDDLKWEDEK